LEAVGWEYGTFDKRPMDDEVDPRDELLSWGFGACLGASNPFDIVDFCLGGFVIRRALLTDLLVSLHFVRKRV
jgi:hypothetical protein